MRSFLERIIFSSLILALAAVSCDTSRYDTDAVLDSAQRLMAERPDSALCIMRSIDKKSIRGSSRLARYSLLYSQAADKNHIDIDNDSLIRCAVDHYAAHGPAELKALAYYYLGCVHYNADDETSAAQALVEAEHAALQTSDYYTCGLIYSLWGYLYCSQYSFDEALEAYRKSAEFYDKIGMLDNKRYILEAEGRVFALRDNFDEAINAYRQALDIAVESGDKDNILILSSKIALVRFLAGHPVGDIKSFLRELYKQYNIARIPDADYSMWSMIYLKENKIDSARYMALNMLNNRMNMTAHMKAGNVALLIDIEKLAGNYEKACAYSDRYIALQDSISKRERDNLIQKTERKYNNKLLKNSYESLRVKHKYQIAIILLAASIVIMVAVAVIRQIILHRRKIVEVKNCEIAKYLELLSTVNTNYSTLQIKYKELEGSLTEDDEKEARLLHALKRRMEGLGRMLEYAYIYENKAEMFYDTFKKYIDESRSEENSFSDLQYVVNKKYHGIIDYLKTKHPKLNNDDLDLCSMICFGFSPNSIRIIYNHKNLDSVYNKRARLHKKLGLSDKLKLEGYIKETLDSLS